MVVGDVPTGTDVLVIGGGPGGYTAAIRAAQHGLDATLVEREAYGGTCLNYGCIPSKALLAATDIAHEARNAEEVGIHADPTIDMRTLVEWKDEVVDQLTGGVETLCEANGVNLIEGTAAFVDERTVRIAHGGEGQGSESVEFEHAVIATGSRPLTIPGFDFEDDPIWSSRDALDASTVPDELLVVGAGYIGMELSTALAKAGADVTVVEMLDDALPNYGDDVTRVVRDRVEALGVEFHFGERAIEWRDEDRIEVVTEIDGGDEAVYAADRVLVSVGREPVTDGLRLDEISLETDEQGILPTDDRMRTDIEHVTAIGDVAGEPMLAHAAMAEGLVAAGVAAGEPVAVDHRAVPGAVFTDPEIGTVGMTKTEAADAGYEPIVGTMPLRASGRALTMSEPDGFVRLVADKETEFVLGGEVVAPEASELIGEIGLAVEMGARLEDVALTIHAHPTLSEAVMEAAENARDRAIHTRNR
ncbi:dihydrolipoyl dehydrogenase [Halosolutus gelatinilyticus]|uniref:dihydrolipoyl dehydrogenase n=1 Tax=Halosolutus gelatinilyticus TaxID=2931975 RepID=UPI001FF42F13|nr:dihydrolipoyl dehydrogenase [Halosolutus gelatinilyticus]